MTALAAELSKSLKPTVKTPLKVAVFDLTTPDGEDCGLGSIVAEQLTTEIFRHDKFEVIERRQLSRVLEEQQMSTSDLLDPSSAARLGRVLGADGIVTGTISATAQTHTFNVRIILVESSSVVAVAQGETANQNLASLGTCGGTQIATSLGTQTASRRQATGASAPLLFEDFSRVPEGRLPSGWEGGANAMVVKDRGRSKLRAFQPGPQVFFIPAPELPEHFAISLSFDSFDRCCETAKLTIGNIEARLHSNEQYLSINASNSERNNGDFGKPLVWTIEYNNDIVTAKLNGTTKVTARVLGFTRPETIGLDLGTADSYSLSSITILRPGD